jgi:hypothetical protein
MAAVQLRAVSAGEEAGLTGPALGKSFDPESGVDRHGDTRRFRVPDSAIVQRRQPPAEKAGQGWEVCLEEGVDRCVGWSDADAVEKNERDPAQDSTGRMSTVT